MSDRDKERHPFGSPSIEFAKQYNFDPTRGQTPSNDTVTNEHILAAILIAADGIFHELTGLRNDVDSAIRSSGKSNGTTS